MRTLCLTWLALLASAAPALEPVELVGTARDFKVLRDWQSYYWRDDFHFTLALDGGKTWKVLSREPTPAYTWRMGPTWTGLKMDWAKNPRVKIVGVAGVDRLPRTFHDLKLEPKTTITALALWVETKPGDWQEFYVNNWFHPWGAQADAAMHRLHAGKKAPYDIYGFVKGQVAPFSKEAQGVIARHPRAKMFHGLIRATKDNPFGHEIVLLHLIVQDEGGNGIVVHGDPKTLPLLDGKK